MSEQKIATRAELEQQVKQLQFSLNTADRREEILANKLGQKERENVDLSVKLDQIMQGYQAQQQSNQEMQGKLDRIEKEKIDREPQNAEVEVEAK